MAKVNPKADVKAAVKVDQHESDLKERKAASDKKQPALRRTLDAEAAAEAEVTKPRDQYRVSCSANPRSANPNDRRESVVTAQNEDEAWAKFCDQSKSWPSPNWCDRKVEKVA